MIIRFIRNCIFLMALTMCFAERSSDADILYRHDGSPAMVGRFVSETERQVTFQEHFKSGATKKQTLFKADVLLLVRTIDDNRLEAMTPAKPQAYFDYAEELSAFKMDFVAQQMATRLYLLSAHHSKDQLRQSSLLALHQLFSSEKQKRRTRALALLTLAPRFHRPFVVNQRPNQLSNATREKLLEIVKNMRSGKKPEAARLLKTDEIKVAMRRHPQLGSWNELYRIAISDKLDNEQYLRLVKTELAIIELDTVKPQPVGYRWFIDAQSTDEFETRWITFGNLTRFDPNQSVFRNQKWVQPNK